jgi:hypothetical protein
MSGPDFPPQVRCWRITAQLQGADCNREGAGDAKKSAACIENKTFSPARRPGGSVELNGSEEGVVIEGESGESMLYYSVALRAYA